MVDHPLRLRLNVLKGTDLNGYLFVDFPHAHDWMAQKFVTPAGYSISLVDVQQHRPCSECGRERTPSVRRVIRTYSPAQFLRLRKMPTR